MQGRAKLLRSLLIGGSFYTLSIRLQEFSWPKNQKDFDETRIIPLSCGRSHTTIKFRPLRSWTKKKAHQQTLVAEGTQNACEFQRMKNCGLRKFPIWGQRRISWGSWTSLVQDQFVGIFTRLLRDLCGSPTALILMWGRSLACEWFSSNVPFLLHRGCFYPFHKQKWPPYR